MNEQHHEMVLEKTHTSGEEEWHCLSCGRRMLINWQPHFKKVILEVGNVYARHSASKGLLPNRMTSAAPDHDDTTKTEPETAANDLSLAPWLTWFEQINFDSLWDKP
jgi:hypothetical protein